MNNLNPATQEAYDLLHAGGLALARCEQHGMRVDVKYIHKQQKKINKRITKLENEFKETKLYRRWQKKVSKKINIYSDDQLRELLFEIEGHKIEKRTNKGNASVDAETLQALDIPDLQAYMKIGKLKTLRDTFLASLEREQVDGVVHPYFHLHIPVTYRGSSSDPNFQNFPKRDEEQMNIIRGAIYPSKGHQILELDYSQLEVRIAAAYHQDPTMLKYINDKTTDMHRDMAQQIFKIKKYDKSKVGHGTARSATKNGFVFPAFYGDYHVGFAESLASAKWMNLPKYGTWKKSDGIEFQKGNIAGHLMKKGIDHLGLPVYKNKQMIEKASGFTKHLQDIERHFWNERFPVYNQWKDDWYAEYLKKGYFYNKTGFTFQGVMNKKDCINYPVQSSAFHVLLWALIQATEVMRNERWKTKIIGQIHDAIVFDVHPDELDHVIKVMKCIMQSDVRQHWKWINVPLEIEAELCPVDAPWSRKEDYKIH